MKKEIKIIFGLALLINLGNSLINAYYAPFLLEKGVNETTVGIIISIYSFVILITTPFYASTIKIIGRKKTFIITTQLQVT